MTDPQRTLFTNQGYLVLQEVLEVKEIGRVNATIDEDLEISKSRENRGECRIQNANVMITTVTFHGTITHPKILPLVEALVRPGFCFGEFSVMHRDPIEENHPDPSWHRDTLNHSLVIQNL
ncbi:MAG: hypothetical protein VX910_10195 [Candidatus Latescibacterota bacterium]|nr:hypothetical protein [Candidatus Latescibacterota bacterium]